MLKESLLFIKNDFIVQYYILFYNTFTADYFGKIILILLSDKQSYFLHHVHYLNNQIANCMFVYLQKLPSFYLRTYSICLWFKKHLLKKTGITRKHKHHIMPRFLINNYKFPCDKINISYNYIKVNWLIHYILHTIRLIEWGQPEDNRTIRILINQKISGSEQSPRLFLFFYYQHYRKAISNEKNI